MKFSFNIITLLLIALTILCYIFRGIILTFGISFIPYILTIVLLFIFFIKKKHIQIDKSVHLFFTIGMFMTFVSFFTIKNNSLIASISGFLVLYINLLLWILILKSLKQGELTYFFDLLSKLVFVCAIISAILAVYQIFFDVTIMGLAQSGLYSDEEAMASGRWQSRATALFSSAQNFGFFIGMAFCIVYNIKMKWKVLWYIGLFIILIGVLVSNSRSASACIIIALFFGAYYKFKKVNNLGIFILIIFVAVSIIVLALTQLLDSEYGLLFSRLVEFETSQSQSVYSEVLDKFNTTTYFTGFGIGYRSWTVNSLLGPDLYFISFGEEYHSVESMFLSLLAQGGIFLLVSFVFVVYKSLINSRKRETMPIILCMVVNMIFTPSMTGLAISFIFWPYLLRELIVENNKKRDLKCIDQV